MQKIFKHRKTGDIAYYKDGIFKQGGCCMEIGVEPSSEVWEEIQRYKLISNPNGIWQDNEGNPYELGTVFCLEQAMNGKSFEYWYRGQEKYFEPILEEKLFTTKDGIDIYEGDSVYIVGKTTFKYLEFSANKSTIHSGDIKFSTKEAAEKYIEENKPQYSLNDMLKVANHFAYVKNVTLERVLKAYKNDSNKEIR